MKKEKVNAESKVTLTTVHYYLFKVSLDEKNLLKRVKTMIKLISRMHENRKYFHAKC